MSRMPCFSKAPILQQYLLFDLTLFQRPDLTATKTQVEQNLLKLGNALRTLVDHPLGFEREISSFEPVVWSLLLRSSGAQRVD